MKNFFLAIVAFIFIINGCASLKTAQIVDDNNNLISMGYPKIKIKVNQSLKYSSHEKESFSIDSFSGGEYSTHEKYHRFLFKDENKKGRSLLIMTSKLISSNWYYSLPLFKSNDGIEYGKITIDGREFEYLLEADNTKKQTSLIKVAAKVMGAHNNSKIIFVYKDTVEGNWDKPIHQIDDSQKKMLEAFNDDFNKAFNIL